MAVIRVEKNKNYTSMMNYHLRNKNLSLKAKGLMSVILSLPDTWKYSMSGLVSICKEGESSVKAALKELENEGFVVITKLYPNQTKSGRIEYVYTIYEEPIKQDSCNQGIEIQDIENLPLEVQPVENHGQINTNRVNTEVLSTDKSSTEESLTALCSSNNSSMGIKKKVSKSFDELIDGFTDNEDLRSSLRGFLQSKFVIWRKQNKVLTSPVLEADLTRLAGMSSDPYEMKMIVDKAVSRGGDLFYSLTDSEKPYVKDEADIRWEANGGF